MIDLIWISLLFPLMSFFCSLIHLKMPHSFSLLSRISGLRVPLSFVFYELDPFDLNLGVFGVMSRWR